MEQLIPIMVPLIVFTAIAAIILVPRWLRGREQEKLLEVIRTISEKGMAPAPQLLEVLSAYQGGVRLQQPIPAPERDMRRGASLVAVAAAMLALAAVIYMATDFRQVAAPLVGAAAFPGFLGLTQIGFWLAAMSKHGV